MPEPPGSPPTPPEVQARLHAVAQLLRQAEHLTPQARRALAELVDELSDALSSPGAGAAETARLTESTAHLLEALGRRHDTGVLAAARDRVDEAIVAAETKAPVAAGLARRLVEALSNIGI
jgi:hypothetical protein